MTTVRRWTGIEARALREARLMSVRAFADRLGVGVATVSAWEQQGAAARLRPSSQRLLADDFAAAGAEVQERFIAASSRGSGSQVALDDELDALELARRVEASDISAETLERLRVAVDQLATDYPVIAPDQLLGRVRRHLAYVGRLDVRKTLEQQRQLLVIGGWLSLLAATLHIDLRDRPAADARLITAMRMAEHASDGEILAWCLETRAWDVLTEGDFARAATLSQQAQRVAPRGGSAHIQATAQESRAWARLGRAVETRNALGRVHRLVSMLPEPERPEHHYQYDPAKAVSYTATILAWVGDPAAEAYARVALAQLEPADGAGRPRRAAAARLDLGLALVAAGKHDEANAAALAAVTSGRIVPSNQWRVDEILTAVEAAGLPEAVLLREARMTQLMP